MKAIFTNNAISNISVPVGVNDMEIFVDDLSKFPYPVVGEEYFMATLVGNCDDRVEIVRVVANTGNSLRIDKRGDERTIPQVFNAGDGIFHALTAGIAQEIVGMWQWYLGPFADPPTTDNQGYPLVAGHLYYNIGDPTADPQIPGQMFVWDGDSWDLFNPRISGVQIESYMWNLTDLIVPGEALPWPDSQGKYPANFVEGNHVIDLYLNGSKLIQQIGDVSIVKGDYWVDYPNNRIIMLYAVQQGDFLEAAIVLRSDVDNASHDFMKWVGAWTNIPHLKNSVVVDLLATYVATRDTPDRPTPVDFGDPSSGLPTTPPWDITVPVLGVVEVGNVFNITADGKIKSIFFFGLSEMQQSGGSFIIELADITNGDNVLFSASITDVSVGSWNEIIMPDIQVKPGSAIRVQLTFSSQTSGINYSKIKDYWDSNTKPFWAIPEGHFVIDNVIQPSVNDCFGADLEFQPTDISPDWDLVAAAPYIPS